MWWPHFQKRYEPCIHQLLVVCVRTFLTPSLMQTANEWKKEGWREKGMWRFLGDFGDAVGKKGKA